MAKVERLQGGAFRMLARLPGRVQLLLSGGSPVRIDGQELEPDVQLTLRLLERFGGPEIERLPVPQAREQLRREAARVSGRPLPVARVEHAAVAGAAGLLDARLYVPHGSASPSPLLVYFHGGGWVVGDLDTHDPVCRFLAREAGMRVLSVDYRRAPEHPFPAPVEDAAAALSDAIERAETFGADPARVAVGGDSAGGNLATVATRLAVLGGGPVPAFQLLSYPVTDLSRKRRSYALFREGFFLTERQMDWYRAHYLVDAEAALDPRASPVLAEDLGGLPPAHIAVAGFDPLRDEGEDYAERLRDFGVQVTLTRHSGLIHGFVNAAALGGSPGRAALEVAAALRAGLAKRPVASRG
jgi:acetyl esterase